MSDFQLPPKDQALNLLREALDTGVRGNLRAKIEEALKVGEGRYGKRGQHLTDFDLQQLPDGGRILDPACPGLMMRAGKRSGKQWLYRYLETDSPRQVELKIGLYPDMGLQKAREVWRELRQQRLQGRTPQLQQHVGEDLTVAEMCRRYIEVYSKKMKASWRSDVHRIEGYIIPALGHIRAVDLTEDEIQALVNSIALRGKHDKDEPSPAPVVAHQVRATLRRVYNIALKRNTHGTIDKAWLPKGTVNPVMATETPHFTHQQYNPTLNDLRNFMRGLDRIGLSADALLLQAQCFARISEVRLLPWSEIDFEQRIWFLPAERAKNRQAHQVMLSAQSIELLERIRRGPAGKGKYVFPGPRTASEPLRRDVIMHGLARRRGELGIDERMSSHDLRRAGLSWVQKNGGDRDIRNRLSNHKPSGSDVDALYAQDRLDGPAREWTQRWCDYLDSLRAANVTRIEEARG